MTVAGKVSVVEGVTVRMGTRGGGGLTAVVPVPVSVSVCVEAETLSVRVMVSENVPAV